MDKSQSEQKGDALSNNADDSARQAKQIGKWAVPAVGVLAAAATCPPAVMALGLLYGLTKLGSSGGGGGKVRIAPDGQAGSCQANRCQIQCWPAGDRARNAHVTLSHAVECDAIWNEDKAPARTDPPAAPRAEIEERADALYGTANPPSGIGTYVINFRGLRP